MRRDFPLATSWSSMLLKHPLPAQKPWQEGGSDFKCYQCEQLKKSKQKLRKHIRNKHTYLQKPEQIRGDESTNTSNMSVLSEERFNTSLPLDNSIVKADTPVKKDMEKTNTYSRIKKAVSYNDRDQKELDRVSEIIHETGNCKRPLPLAY